MLKITFGAKHLNVVSFWSVLYILVNKKRQAGQCRLLSIQRLLLLQEWAAAAPALSSLCHRQVGRPRQLWIASVLLLPSNLKRGNLKNYPCILHRQGSFVSAKWRRVFTSQSPHRGKSAISCIERSGQTAASIGRDWQFLRREGCDWSRLTYDNSKPLALGFRVFFMTNL